MRDEQEKRIDANDVKDPHGFPPQELYEAFEELFDEVLAHYEKTHEYAYPKAEAWFVSQAQNIEQNRAEAAYESFLEAYYGGDLPKETYEQRFNQMNKGS